MTDQLKPNQVFLFRDVLSSCFVNVLNKDDIIKKNIDELNNINLKLPNSSKLKDELYTEFLNYIDFKNKSFNIYIVNTCLPVNNKLISVKDIDRDYSYFLYDNSICINLTELNRVFGLFWNLLKRNKESIQKQFKIDSLKLIGLKHYSAKSILYILKKYILSDEVSKYHIKDPDKVFFNDCNKLYPQNHINKLDREDCIKRLRHIINEK